MSLILFLLSAPSLGEAAFTHPALWNIDAIKQTYAGTWCYIPGVSSAHEPPCTDATLNALIGAHIGNAHGAGLSIAYYSIEDFSTLGGAGWASWDVVGLPVGVCMSGAVDGIANAYSTTCRFAFKDNDHSSPSAHAEKCTVNRAQLRVIDGCYIPPAPRSRFRLDDSTSSVIEILGLLIALSTIAYGTYRRWGVRRRVQQPERDDEPGLQLATIRGGGRRRRPGDLPRASSV